ncbi:MAG: 3',5'-cyclic-nucleotide phosphodiesterase [Wolinella succinogenes]|uniref:DHH family phosphoesterase n=1 Tax=Wolinella succinogenes TaxID=844 RepID=UPI0016B13160|nr:3',5'-cyclic-nucleotide phosphodiesterase [Wolinella succinogenes]NLU34314.1 3',5'-cyclic-nucleotide phosphodiesterase [Wolinella succinogenes]
MHVHHLSHIDLDGYGCQFVASHFFKKIDFYNANYGKEVGAKLEEIARHTKEARPKEILWLITDLNLTLTECAFLEERAAQLAQENKKVTILLLDHHISGSDCAQKYPWYYLDNERSATKITYETLLERFGLQAKKEAHTPWMREFVEVVNAIDLWKEESPCFELGKVLMRMVVETKELNRYMFDREHRDYKFGMIKAAKRYLFDSKGHIRLDNAMHAMKKRLLLGKVNEETLDNIASLRQVTLLGTKRESCMIEYRGHKGFLSYSMGSVSVLANAFLRAYPEFDFFMDVGPRGSVSLRANHRCDVSRLSAELFGGGGHKNAAGGRIEGFKESFLYDEVKKNIEQMIKEKTQ